MEENEDKRKKEKGERHDQNWEAKEYKKRQGAVGGLIEGET